MAGYGPGGDAMIPVGFGETATLPYFSNNKAAISGYTAWC